MRATSVVMVWKFGDDGDVTVPRNIKHGRLNNPFLGRPAFLQVARLLGAGAGGRRVEALVQHPGMGVSDWRLPGSRGDWFPSGFRRVGAMVARQGSGVSRRGCLHGVKGRILIECFGKWKPLRLQ